jgi:DNA polymerase
MGTNKFAARVAAQGIDLTAANTTAEAVVDGYRDAYPAIAGVKITRDGKAWRQGGLWKDVEKAAREALLQGKAQAAGRCLFDRDGSSLVLELPSGRKITYRNARLETSTELNAWGRPRQSIVFDGPGRRDRDETTYGGKLVENIVQAVCRDLMSSAVLECERRGLPVVLHVHDEIVLELPEAEAESGLGQLVTIMSTPPAWAAAFPVQVEGYVAERYRKSPAKGAPRLAARQGMIIA